MALVLLLTTSSPARGQCDWPFAGFDCEPTPLLPIAGATFGEHFVGQQVVGDVPDLETVSGLPVGPLQLSWVPGADGVTEYLGAILGLGGDSCAADSFGEGLVSVLFDGPKASVTLTGVYWGGGTARVQAFAQDGTLLVELEGTGSFVIDAPPGMPIRGLTLEPHDEGGLAWRLSAEPWNTLLDVDPRVADNAAAHHTGVFVSASPAPLGMPIVRRGDTDGLLLDVALGTALDSATHELRLVRTSSFDGPLEDTVLHTGVPSVDGWLLEDAGSSGSNASLRLHVPVDAAVGRYGLRAELFMTACGQEMLVDARDLPGPLDVLFDPWGPGDAVFLADPDERAEAVLADDGVVFRDERHAHPWRFAPFSPQAHLAAITLLEGLGTDARRDPGTVAAWMNAGVGASGAGLLAWVDAGPSAQTSPFQWTGTDQVLAAALADGTPVSAAHDWVLAGALTTFGRTLGLPSRVVTLSPAGFDADGNGVIDLDLDQSGHPLFESGADRIAPAHAWVETWMVRPELSDGSGWQVLDPTPWSGAVLGPVPVAWVASPALATASGAAPGIVSDAAALRSVVSPLVRHWRSAGSGSTTSLVGVQAGLARRAVTRTPGHDAPRDMSASYGLKSPPSVGGGPLVRGGDGVGGIPGGVGAAGVALAPAGVVLTLEGPDDVPIGADAGWSIGLHASEADGWPAHVAADLLAISPTGDVLGSVASLDLDVLLDGNAPLRMGLLASAADTAPWFATASHVRAQVTVEIPESGETLLLREDARLARPAPVVAGEGTAIVLPTGGAKLLDIHWAWPGAGALTNVQLTATGGDGLLLDGAPVWSWGPLTLDEGGALDVPVLLEALSAGGHLLSLTLAADGLDDVVGSVLVAVDDAWVDLGFELPLSAGPELLPLEPVSAGVDGAALLLTGVPPLSPAWLVVGASTGATPFHGGVLVPSPVLDIVTLTSDAAGHVLVPWSGPGAGPVLQAWMPGQGTEVLASNALSGTVTP